MAYCGEHVHFVSLFTFTERLQAHMYSGDSYSDTAFDVLGTPPSTELPMGNTPFYEDRTGPRWPLHLTELYNDSTIKTYCFAHAGSSIDQAIDNNVGATDLVEQVEDICIPSYVDYDFGGSDWNPDTSLFIIFFGINDNRLLLEREGRERWIIQERILERYTDMLREVRLKVHNLHCLC